ncbi:hypothetical protein [Salinispira pacifica]|uniref:Lipoprotein n=1 Tax=Salinispira pacifica TaxID=1307761 RepID=V5WK35_9SPIO|nr:hypothetical protein [Salinispira pacifica]AHC15531.1 hypothetical protein L21SP2_2168 [Salinispira pacifica]
MKKVLFALVSVALIMSLAGCDLLQAGLSSELEAARTASAGTASYDDSTLFVSLAETDSIIDVDFSEAVSEEAGSVSFALSFTAAGTTATAEQDISIDDATLSSDGTTLSIPVDEIEALYSSAEGGLINAVLTVSGFENAENEVIIPTFEQEIQFLEGPAFTSGLAWDRSTAGAGNGVVVPTDEYSFNYTVGGSEDEDYAKINITLINADDFNGDSLGFVGPSLFSAPDTAIPDWDPSDLTTQETISGGTVTITVYSANSTIEFKGIDDAGGWGSLTEYLVAGSGGGNVTFSGLTPGDEVTVTIDMTNYASWSPAP